MKNESLKKIMDIFFEPDEVVTKEVVADAPMEDVKPMTQKVVTTPEVKAEIPQAKPKTKKTSSFLDVAELQVKKTPTVTENPQPKEGYQYEPRPAISPMFGYLNSPSDHGTTLSTPQIKTDAGISLLGTVYSPYYGVMSQKPNVKKSEPNAERVSINPIPSKPKHEIPLEVDVPDADLFNFDDLSFDNEILPEENHSLEEMLDKPQEEKLNIDEEEISLFDDLFIED